MGGYSYVLGLIPTVIAAQQHTCSLHTNSPLVDLIVSQTHSAASYCANQVQLCSNVATCVPPNERSYRSLPGASMISFHLTNCEKGGLTWFCPSLQCCNEASQCSNIVLNVLMSEIQSCIFCCKNCCLEASEPIIPST